ncbi:MAG TPA: hypothetical protein VIS05_03095 [Ilumatobacter sp.]
MSALWIDPEPARRVALVWAERGDAWFRVSTELTAELDRLHLHDAGDTAARQLAAASTESWVLASLTRLVADRAAAADAAAPVDAATIARWLHRAGAQAQLAMPAACVPDWAAFAFSPARGDLGETGDTELRTPYLISGSTPVERGRAVVTRALTDVGDPARLRPDEFELVRLDGDRYLIVLPGVIDLTSPRLGLDPANRSVRDLDRHAVASARSTSVGDNRYARMVWDAVVAAGVPAGARVMIVGHSFGADTALDLAADAGFNGPEGFSVTHVVAAGYHSGPQLATVPPATEVLVLQNRWDAAVIGEMVGHPHVVGAIDEAATTVAALGRGDPAAAVTALGGLLADASGAALDGARFIADQRAAWAGAAIAVATGQLPAATRHVADAVTPRPGVRRTGERQVVDVFAGGFAGAGHHPDHYAAHLESTDDPAVVAFLASVADGGYADHGTAWAVDVSVPDAR